MYNLGKEEEQLNTVWTRINEDVPEYMKKVCEKYGMVCEKISPLETILYNRKCCLIIQIDKLHITILCVKDINGKMHAYDCSSYFAMRFDNEDKQGLITVEKAGDNIKNELIVVANGFVTKCEDVFTGDKNWLKSYQDSSRCSDVRLTSETINVLKARIYE